MQCWSVNRVREGGVHGHLAACSMVYAICCCTPAIHHQSRSACTCQAMACPVGRWQPALWSLCWPFIETLLPVVVVAAAAESCRTGGSCLDILPHRLGLRTFFNSQHLTISILYFTAVHDRPCSLTSPDLAPKRVDRQLPVVEADK